MSLTLNLLISKQRMYNQTFNKKKKNIIKLTNINVFIKLKTHANDLFSSQG